MNKRTIAPKLLLFIALGLLKGGRIFAQTPEKSKSSTLGISLGYSFNGYREETILDINRYLNTLIYSINGSIENNRFYHSFHFGFFRGNLEVKMAYPVYQYEQQPDIFGQLFKYYNMEDTYTRIFFEYALDYRLWGNKTFPGYLGGAVRVDAYLLETLRNPVYINFTGLASLNLHAGQKWIINSKNSISFFFSFPVFAYAIRPHYIGFSAWPVESGIASLHNYWAGFGNLKYQYIIYRWFSLYSDLGLEITRIDFPKPRRDASISLSLGTAFAF